MAATKEFRKKFYNACNPDEPLQPDDQRNFDIDVETPEARGTNVVDMLVEKIALSNKPVCELFTGLPGSGKSTELRRLAAKLRSEDEAHLLPVLIDAEEVLDLYNPIDVPDILMAIVLMTDAAVLSAEARDPRDALRETPASRFWNWLTRTEVELKGGEIGAGATVGAGTGATGKLVLQMKDNPTLRRKVRDKVAAEMMSFVRDVAEAIQEMEARAKRLRYSGLLILFDSLEKLRGISTNWAEVLQSAERVFAGGAPYLKLPVHVVYTFPPALALRLTVPVHYLPMLKLFDRRGKRSDDGFEAARQLIRRRVPDEAINEFFGPTSRDNRVQRLIEWSGGYPREIVRILQRCILERSPSEPSFRRILSMSGDDYRRVVPTSAYEWLAQVHVKKALSIKDDDHHPIADRMLTQNVVLRYQNDNDWFDVHPAVLEIPGIQAEVERLRAEGEGPSSGAA